MGVERAFGHRQGHRQGQVLNNLLPKSIFLVQ
jgi:hypothetical protein